MWSPDTIPVPKILVQAEIDRKVPTGTTLAIAAFMMMKAWTSEKAANVSHQLGVGPDAHATAWTFLETSRIVTNGENESVVIVASPTESETSSPPVGEDHRDEEVIALFEKYFPNEDYPSPSQLDKMFALADSTDVVAHIDDVLYQMANSGSIVKTPVVLCLWKLREESRDKHAKDRKKLESKPLSDDAIVMRKIREAEAMLPTLVKPEASEERIESIKQMKEKISRGRPI